MLILDKVHSMPSELERLTDYAVMATQKSGWMTYDLWLRYAIEFVHQVSHYRTSLPPSLREQRITLISDGHASRNNVLAAKYLLDNKIDLVILPAHTSHCLQPFDVGLASSLKTRDVRQLRL